MAVRVSESEVTKQGVFSGERKASSGKAATGGATRTLLALAPEVSVGEVERVVEPDDRIELRSERLEIGDGLLRAPAGGEASARERRQGVSAEGAEKPSTRTMRTLAEREGAATGAVKAE